VHSHFPFKGGGACRDEACVPVPPLLTKPSVYVIIFQGRDGSSSSGACAHRARQRTDNTDEHAIFMEVARSIGGRLARPTRPRSRV